jgi:hypothetical protein
MHSLLGVTGTALDGVRGGADRQSHRPEEDRMDKASPGRWHSIAAAATMLVVLGVVTSGCAVVMAAKQPSKKDLGLLSPGVPRNLVLAELGQPVATETRTGKRVEVYSFVQGYSKGVRVSRSIAHGAADVFTLGLWEAVGTPTEAIFDGTRVAYEVTYDASDRVEQVVVLKQ